MCVCVDVTVQFGTVDSTGHDVVCCPVLQLLALGENKLNTDGAIPGFFQTLVLQALGTTQPLGPRRRAQNHGHIDWYQL